MKTIQVIERLKDLIEDRKSFLEENGVGDEVFRADIEALDVAIEIIEKQIPKKPHGIDTNFSYFVCSTCKQPIYYSDEKESHKYCLNCGQKLRWEKMTNFERVTQDKISRINYVMEEVLDHSGPHINHDTTKFRSRKRFYDWLQEEVDND